MRFRVYINEIRWNPISCVRELVYTGGNGAREVENVSFNNRETIELPSLACNRPCKVVPPLRRMGSQTQTSFDHFVFCLFFVFCFHFHWARSATIQNESIKSIIYIFFKLLFSIFTKLLIKPTQSWTNNLETKQNHPSINWFKSPPNLFYFFPLFLFKFAWHY